MIRLKYALCVLIIAAGVGIRTLSLQPPRLAEIPWRSERWSFQVHPPIAWSVVNFESSADQRSSGLPDLRVQVGERPLDADKAGLVVAFAEQRPGTLRHGVTPTITVAVRPVPQEFRQALLAEGATAFAMASLAVLEKALSRVTPVLPFSTEHFSGASADYAYRQKSAQTQEELSISAIALLSERRDRYFLLTATAPSKRSDRYRRLLEQIARSLHDSQGAHRT